MSTRRTAGCCAVLLLGVAMLSACVHPPKKGPPPAQPTTTTTGPPETGILFEYTMSGVGCTTRECEFEMTVRRDGSFHRGDGLQEQDGQLDRFVLVNLLVGWEEGVGKLAHLPRNLWPCPSAWGGGSDITITLHAGGETVTVSNCAQPPAKSVHIPGLGSHLQYIVDVVNFWYQGLPSLIIFRYQVRGGVCPEGPCPEEQVVLRSDGTWTATRATTAASGTLDLSALVEIWRRYAAEINDPRPFTFEPAASCASANGGREVLVTFGLYFSQPNTFSDCTSDLSSNEFVAYMLNLSSELR